MANSPIVLGMSVRAMVTACSNYARAHRQFHGFDLKDDRVLGPCFADIVTGLLGLLDGELGTYDGGTLWKALDDAAKVAGYKDLDELREDV